MIQKGIDYLENAKTYNGETVKTRLDNMLKDPDIKFGFGLEHYRLAKGMYVEGRYILGNGKSYDLGPREREYILEKLRPDTLDFLKDFNNVKIGGTYNLVKRLDQSKICEDLKKDFFWRLAYKEALKDPDF